MNRGEEFTLYTPRDSMTTKPGTASTSHNYIPISNSDIDETKTADLCPIDRYAYDIFLMTKTLKSKQ